MTATGCRTEWLDRVRVGRVVPRVSSPSRAWDRFLAGGGMDMEELYYLNSYLREFDAQVVRSDPEGIILDRTGFYARSGGQPSDAGELQAGGEHWPVIEVRRRAGVTLHVVEGLGPNPGTNVTGVLDWDLRYRCMRLHTALHALSAVVWAGWQADVTGSHIYDDGTRARMDFSLEGVRINDIKSEIEKRLNMELAAQRDVKIYDLPRAEALELPDLIRTHINLVPEHMPRIRIVEIETLDRQADGGTHVANTREVGQVEIVKVSNKGRINRRLEIALVN